jgi:anti-sigma B factor antagonist
MEITHTETSGVVIIAIQGQLDATTAPNAQAAIGSILAAGHERLLFDLSLLEYLSSDGLRIILGTAKQLTARGGKIVLCALTDYVHEIFEVTHLTSLLPIKESVEAGLLEFQ